MDGRTTKVGAIIGEAAKENFVWHCIKAVEELKLAKWSVDVEEVVEELEAAKQHIRMAMETVRGMK